MRRHHGSVPTAMLLLAFGLLLPLVSAQTNVPGLAQTVSVVNGEKWYYLFGDTPVSYTTKGKAPTATIIRTTVHSTIDAAQPTLVYNCYNMAAICKNVKEWMAKDPNSRKLPYTFVYDRTTLEDRKKLWKEYNLGKIGGISLDPKRKKLSEHRRHQVCDGSAWKKHYCPQPGQPSVIKSRRRTDWKQLDPWFDPTKMEWTRWIAARQVTNAQGQLDWESSGRRWSCDEFPAASWIEGGAGPDGQNPSNTFCAPIGGSASNRCDQTNVNQRHIFDLVQKGKKAIPGNYQMTEQNWQGDAHGKLSAAIQDIYGDVKYAHFQFTTTDGPSNGAATSSRAWVVIPVPVPTILAIIQKRDVNSAMQTPEPFIDVVTDEGILERWNNKSRKADRLRERQEKLKTAISLQTQAAVPTASTATLATSSAKTTLSMVTAPPTMSLASPDMKSVTREDKPPPSASTSGLDEPLKNTPLWQARRIIELAQKEAGQLNREIFENPRRNRYPHIDNNGPLLQRRSIEGGIYHEGTGVNKTIAELAALLAEVDSGALEVTANGTAITTSASVPSPSSAQRLQKRADKFWMEAMNHDRASMPFGGDSSYKVFRNVKDYGAKGDGKTDDTAAINKAISDGNRCGADCGSSTVKGAVVYFPAGTYLVSSPIIQYYYTQFVGDAKDWPKIKASKSFVGLGMLSSNVYIEGGDGAEWYINQNNFYRQIRNFILDIRDMPSSLEIPAAIHWQVAQGSSLQNINFIMSREKNTRQMGIFMENGSGGWLSELMFVGGKYGMFCGNQQFTSRDLAFNGQQTAIRMIWDWGWTWKNLVINDCDVGISLVPIGGNHPQKRKVKRADEPPPPGQPNLGSVMVMDSFFHGVKTAIQLLPPPETGSHEPTMHLYNVHLREVGAAIAGIGSGVILAGGDQSIDSYGTGWVVDDNNVGGFQVRGKLASRPNVHSSLLSTPDWARMLLGDNVKSFFSARKPQYENEDVSSFMSVQKMGAKGDGVTDDTIAINNAIVAAIFAKKILFFPAGSYIVTDTIDVMPGSRIVGQAWSQIVATGKNFNDQKNPRVMVRVGRQGYKGLVELTDMLFTTKGPTAGVVLMEWNISEESQGSAAMWDCHFRVGGAKGSDLQAVNCPKLTGQINPNCFGASMLLHMTKWSSAYMENVWIWVADHDLDVKEQTQIDVYSGRGILIESRGGPTWLYGTASEHNVLYQYQLLAAEKVFLAGIQTESPYYQVSPPAPAPLENAGQFRGDPSFNKCKDPDADHKKCGVSWGLRIVRSRNIYLFGGGLYSWFQNYEETQACVKAENCQQQVFHVMRATELWVFNLFTKGVVEMVSPWSGANVIAAKFKNTYVSTLLGFFRGIRGISNGGNAGPGAGSGSGSITKGTAVNDYGVVYMPSPTPSMRVTYPDWFWQVKRPPASCIYPCEIVLPPIHASQTVQPPPMTLTLGQRTTTITPAPVTDIVFPWQTVTIDKTDPDPVTITPKLVKSTFTVSTIVVTIEASESSSTYRIVPPPIIFPLPTKGPNYGPPCGLLCDFPPKRLPPVVFGYGPPLDKDSPPPGPPPSDDEDGGSEDHGSEDGNDNDDGKKRKSKKDKKANDKAEDVDPSDIDHPPPNNKPKRKINDGGDPPSPGPNPPPPGPPGPPGGDGGADGGYEPEEDEEEDEEDEESCENYLNDMVQLPKTYDSQPPSDSYDPNSNGVGEGTFAMVNGGAVPAYGDYSNEAGWTALDTHSGQVVAYSGTQIHYDDGRSIANHFCRQAFQSGLYYKIKKGGVWKYSNPNKAKAIYRVSRRGEGTAALFFTLDTFHDPDPKCRFLFGGKSGKGFQTCFDTFMRASNCFNAPNCQPHPDNNSLRGSHIDMNCLRVGFIVGGDERNFPDHKPPVFKIDPKRGTVDDPFVTCEKNCSQ